ncbi:MAG: nuclear transport factor 2 family protein [Candidatus Zixiibacteriota bacterium]
MKKPEDIILSLEKAALEKWSEGDTSGFAALSTDEMTYFDPTLDDRLDGGDAFEKYMSSLQGKFHIDRFEIKNTKIQLHGDVGILTFNLNNYSKDGKITSRWNSTEVYHLIGGEWKIIHSHWSNPKSEN